MRRLKPGATATVAIAIFLSLIRAAAEADSDDTGLGKPLLASTYSPQTPRRSHALSAAAVHRAEGFDPRRLRDVLSALEADHISTRGAAEARLYSKTAPGVVLISTKDALGSGSVISPKGLILTNLHVVGSSSVVAVVFKPSVEGAVITSADAHRGMVVRRDQIADLALVQVADPPPNLTTIPLGHLGDVSVGSDVHAIGHPTGEAWSYTKGIVSQVRRNYAWHTEDGLRHTASVIQTQTPINPGNSGGPLLTDKGAIVGVNSFKSEGEGLNFAVSADDVRVLLSEKTDRLSAAVGATKSTCTPKSYGVQRLPDGSGTFEPIDLDCFGKPDAQWILPDDPTKPGRLEVDSYHTGYITATYFSKHRDWKWDYSIWDTTGSGKPDVRCVHQDGNPVPTRCEKIAS
jgi:S1-C subfamily serine protease